MTKKTAVQIFTPLLVVVVLATALISISRPAPDIQIDSLLSRPSVVRPFDYEAAANLSAYRWQAMANFYEDNGLLTRDDFDYEAASNLSAYRWQAMANFYKDNGLLTRENFDYEAAANLSAYRWQAMASYYEKHGLLNK